MVQGKLCRAAAAAAAALALVVSLSAGPASAQFEVEEPEVEKGEIEIEYHGATFSGRPSVAAQDDDDDDDDEGPAMLENEVLRQGHEVEITGGVTDWWAFGVGAEFEEERGEDGSFGSLNLSEIEISNRIEIVPMDDDADSGFGAGLFLGYGTTVGKGEEEDTVKVGALLSGKRGKVSATGNLFLVNVFDIRETEIEDGEVEVERTPDHWDFEYAWQLKVQKTERLAFGVEGFGEVPDISGDVAGPTPEKHRIGPVLYLTFQKQRFSPGDDDDANGNGEADEDDDEGPTLNMAFGVLFGLNDDTSDVALKWDVELEF